MKISAIPKNYMEKCKQCKGKGMVQIGPNVRGLTICPSCRGLGKTGLMEVQK